MEFTLKIKNGTALCALISGNISAEPQNTNSKEYMHLYVHHSIIYNSQFKESTQVSISNRVYKTGDIYIYICYTMKYYLAIKNDLTICDSMDGTRVKMNQTEKNKYHMISLYVETKEQYKQKRNKLIDTKNTQIFARGEGTWGTG